MPSSTPAIVPVTPIAAPVIRKMRRIAPRVAPMVRRMAMSLALVLHQHDQAGNDVQRRDQHDQRQDHEHDVALDLQRRKEGLVALPPVGQEDLALRSGFDRLSQRIDAVGIVDENLDRLRAAFHVEIELRLGERHEDDRGVELRHADLEDRDDRIGLHARRRANRRDVAVGRYQRDQVAENQAETVGHALADRHAFAGVEADDRSLLDIAGDDRELAQIVAADAAHQRTGSCADVARGQHLAVDQRHGVFHAAARALMRSATAA